jgi:hypothetical protein
MTTSKAPEAIRDQESTGFTPILRGVWLSTPSVVAVAFADMMGECVDYVSSLDPFDAKVSAAHALIVIQRLLESGNKLPGGVPVMVEIAADEREIWARRVSEEYVLVVVTAAGADRVLVRNAIGRAVTALRDEGGISIPTWDLPPSVLQVEVRTAVGWAYAPSAYHQNGTRVPIAAVIGRWLDDPDAAAVRTVCFRVRNDRNEELTLVHDPSSGQWQLRGAE